MAVEWVKSNSCAMPHAVKAVESQRMNPVCKFSLKIQLKNSVNKSQTGTTAVESHLVITLGTFGSALGGFFRRLRSAGRFRDHVDDDKISH